MAEEPIVTPRGYRENPDLLPKGPKEKVYRTFTFTFMMFSMNTCIPMFLLGPIARTLGCDIWQALAGAFMGNLAAVIVMFLNGVVGVKYGIAFPVQLREPFGFRGTHIPVILRGICGTMWYGIEVWAGSYALTMIALYAIGFPPSEIPVLACRWLVIAILFYLATLVIVMRYELKGIGWMANFGGPIMLLYFAWLTWWLATNPQFAPRISEAFVGTAGWWSMPFLIYLAVQTNWWATVALNISDLSRGLRTSTQLFIALFLGIVICQIVGTALGYYAVVLTGVVVPQDIIVQYAPGAVAVVLGLLFAFLAPWSTDITANAPPLIDILMSVVRLRWKTAVVVAAIIAFFVAPWWAVEKSPQYVSYVTAWASNYGILLGPIAGPMIGNFWIVRKRRYDLQKLYIYGPEGCWYRGGFSIAGYLALFLTIALAYVVAYFAGMLSYVGPVPFPGNVIWYFSVVCSLILYLIFAKVFKEW